jgi:hypothetical protein
LGKPSELQILTSRIFFNQAIASNDNRGDPSLLSNKGEDEG